ncbi:MAG TPA: hypothetical protein VD695_04370 [Gaiellaceae bacterium]|nr:hypothetical protein [Gaiellaceae bacterium]
MELTDWLIALHVLSAFAWIAAMVIYSVLVAGLWRAALPSDVVRLFRVSRVGDALVAIGMIGTIVFGIWLAIDEYEIWDGWIIAALVLWIVAAAIGGRTGATYKVVNDRARSLVADGHDAPSSELATLARTQRGLVLHVAGSLVTLAILVVMVYKPGA